MVKWILSALLTVVAVAGLTQAADAQYMYMDANGNGVHDTGDRLNANNDSTFVDIYLSTTLNRNGSAVTCNTLPAAAMDINSYAFSIVATGGTVTYGTYVNRQPAAFPNHAEVLNPGDGTYKDAFYSFSYTPGGLFRLGTLTITGTSGAPAITFVDLITGAQDYTSFGTECPGIGGDNTYRLDGPNTQAFYGVPGDWFDTDGLARSTTAVSVALQDAQAEAGLVRLRWIVPDARSSVSMVERRTAISDWATLGQADVESGGYVRYEDRSVTPGERYAYRLFVQSPTDNGYSNEVWVLVPSDAAAPLALQLDPVYPNPFQTETRFNFAVPRSGSVRLTIFDVRGRRVATVVERALPSGWRSVAWNGRDHLGRPVPSGTYFAKLEQAGKVQMRKIVVAR
ncbi:MAG: T9SS type A sorting domain-containing protein [Candidatus Eisenbacteria bacterium]|uniref:T9SS type A sorting domain-containing protein n=1 Tax=Eiseniibacteriota bacterium TaxID=2212470 RepID=A0A538TJQ3_UNCEI|nr:MAG: T9SS type A sorting domain-containing protein [Candidatus Eisenbacteria bacterium]